MRSPQAPSPKPLWFRRATSLRPLWFLGLIIPLCLCACTPQEKIVNYKPFFAGVDGSAQDVSIRHGQEYVQEGERAGDSKGRELLQTTIVIENDDGTVTLISQSGSHLMRHIQRTLYHEERDIFTEQVLSAVTRQEFQQRGLDAGIAFDELKLREREVNELFSRMPLGEYTPQVVRTKVGHNVFRVKVTGVGVNDLYWRGYDMILEDGNWKLRWFVR